LVAGEFLADGGALGFGGFAGGVALSRLANRLALGATFLLALVLGATNGAHRLLAMNGALGAGGLLALHLAFRSLAHRVANSGARGIITLPFAARVALGSRGSANSHEGNNEDENSTHDDVGEDFAKDREDTWRL